MSLFLMERIIRYRSVLVPKPRLGKGYNFYLHARHRRYKPFRQGYSVCIGRKGCHRQGDDGLRDRVRIGA